VREQLGGIQMCVIGSGTLMLLDSIVGVTGMVFVGVDVLLT